MTDWAGASYVRVYATLSRDHPDVWTDACLLGWYVRLLALADRAWPGLADVPQGIPDDVMDALVGDQVIDRVGRSLYRFHGLDSERNGQRRRGHAGGVQRASSAVRDPLGRFAGDPNGDAGPSLDSSLVSRVDDDAGPDAGDPASASSDPTSDPTSDPARLDETRPDDPTKGRLVSSPGNPPARAREAVPMRIAARDDPRLNSVQCDDYQAHRNDHRWSDPAGRWICPICEAARALGDRTFREKIADAGGDPW